MSGYIANYLQIEVPYPTFNNNLIDKVLEKPFNDFFTSDGIWRKYFGSHYSVATNKERRQPICAALNIDQGKDGYVTGLKRGPWKLDVQGVGEEFQLDNSYYRGGNTNLWDRGHMAQRNAASWGTDPQKASDETFYYTNCCLQHRNHNNDEWQEVENRVKNLTSDKDDKISVFVGPIYDHPDIEKRSQQSDNENETFVAEVPDGFFKLIVFVNKEGNLETKGYISLQTDKAINENTTIQKDFEELRNADGTKRYDTYLVSTKEVELFTDLVFDKKLHDSNRKKDFVDTRKRISTLIPRREGESFRKQSVFILALLVNPSGNEKRNERVFLANNTTATVDLSGWTISDGVRKDRSLELSGLLTDIIELNPRENGESVQLTNSGGSLTLRDPEGKVIDIVEWDRQREDKTAFFF